MQKRVLDVFRRIDTDGSKTIDKAETLKFWLANFKWPCFRKSNFAKLNTEELFKSVDADNNGAITEDEWVEFWNTVKKSGHTEEEISDELESIENGSSWVKFDNVK
jgi:Ca2+-binding EF-hand superfamily protein